MKVVVRDNKLTEKLPFPKLMKSTKTGQIVLFTSHGVGTRVVKGDDPNQVWTIGYYYHRWIMDRFEDFHGEVTLSNC